MKNFNILLFKVCINQNLLIDASGIYVDCCKSCFNIVYMNSDVK